MRFDDLINFGVELLGLLRGHRRGGNVCFGGFDLLFERLNLGLLLAEHLFEALAGLTLLLFEVFLNFFQLLLEFFCLVGLLGLGEHRAQAKG